MDDWIIRDADLVDKLARHDPLWQELRAELDTLTPAFDRLMERLPEPDRELILEYLNLQVDLEGQKTRLAWLHK